MMTPVAPDNRETCPASIPPGLLGVIRRLERPCVICTSLALSREDVEHLLSLREVGGIMLAVEDRALMEAFPGRFGCYMNGNANWKLPACQTHELLYVGAWSEFGARAAYGAWKSGFRTVRIASGFDPNRQHRLSIVLLRKSLASLLYRAEEWVGGCVRKNKNLVFRIEQFLYRRRLKKIGPLPLPGTDLSWRKGRIIIVGASLGPGGAERQLSATLLGLVSHGRKDVHFLHHWPMNAPNDFYLPLLAEAGIPHSLLTQFGISDKLSPELTRALSRSLGPLGSLGVDINAYVNEFMVRRPEVVHVWQDHMNVVVGLAALLAGVPRIYLSCRSLSPIHFAFNQPYMRPIYRFLAQFPNVTFLNNSKAGAADYSRWLRMKPKHIRIIRNGFDVEGLPDPDKLAQLRDEYRRRNGIPAAAPVIGVVMRISE